MNILDLLNSIYKNCTFKEGASEASIKKLIKFSPIEIPQDFLDLLSKQQDIELDIVSKQQDVEIEAPEEYYLRLWGADYCVEMNQAYEIQEYMPNALAIGSDGGGDALIYINIDNNIGLYIVPFGCSEYSDCDYLAPSLERFLVFGEGIETYKKWAMTIAKMQSGLLMTFDRERNNLE